MKNLSLTDTGICVPQSGYPEAMHYRLPFQMFPPDFILRISLAAILACFVSGLALAQNQLKLQSQPAASGKNGAAEMATASTVGHHSLFRQSGDLFEYLTVTSVAAPDGRLIQGFRREPLPVVATRATVAPRPVNSDWMQYLQKAGFRILNEAAIGQADVITVSYLIDENGYCLEVEVLQAPNPETASRVKQFFLSSLPFVPAREGGKAVAFRGVLHLEVE